MVFLRKVERLENVYNLKRIVLQSETQEPEKLTPPTPDPDTIVTEGDIYEEDEMDEVNVNTA